MNKTKFYSIYILSIFLLLASLTITATAGDINLTNDEKDNPEIVQTISKYQIPWIEARKIKFGQSFSDRNSNKTFLNESVLPEYKIIIHGDEKEMSLESCLKIAYLNSPDIMKAAHEVKQYEAKLRQSLSLYIPEANLILLRSDSGIPVLQDNYWNNSITGEISYLIYDSGKRSLLCKAASDSLMASRYSFLKSWNDKAYNVSLAYYKLIYSYILMYICEDDLFKTSDNLQIAQSFYSTGSKAKIDVTQAEIQVKSSEINLTDAQAQCINAYTSLISEMGMDPKTYKIGKLEDLLTAPPPESLNLELLKERAKTENPMIGYYEYMSKAAMNMSSSYLTDRLPQLSANASWGGYTNWSTSTPSWSFNLQLKIPLLKNTESKAYAKEQEAVAMQALDAQKAIKISAEEAIRSSVIQISSAKRRSEMAYSSVETSLQNYRLSYLRYKNGVSTITELNNAIDFLNSTRKQYLAALYDIRVNEASMLHAIGNGIPEVPKEDFQKAIDSYIDTSTQK